MLHANLRFCNKMSKHKIFIFRQIGFPERVDSESKCAEKNYRVDNKHNKHTQRLGCHIIKLAVTPWDINCTLLVNLTLTLLIFCWHLIRRICLQQILYSNSRNGATPFFSTCLSNATINMQHLPLKSNFTCFWQPLPPVF